MNLNFEKYFSYIKFISNMKELLKQYFLQKSTIITLILFLISMGLIVFYIPKALKKAELDNVFGEKIFWYISELCWTKENCKEEFKLWQTEEAKRLQEIVWTVSINTLKKLCPSIKDYSYNVFLQNYLVINHECYNISDKPFKDYIKELKSTYDEEKKNWKEQKKQEMDKFVKDIVQSYKENLTAELGEEEKEKENN